MKFNFNHFSIEINGESHSKEIELKIKGFELNTKLSFDMINNDLKRRNPKLFFNTQRSENDSYIIKKGIDEFGIINSEEIIVVFNNESVDKSDYKNHKGFLRPSQSDYAQLLKNKTVKTGAGAFSGRMTLPLVFLGSICKQILNKDNTEIYSRIKSIYNIEDENLDFNKIKNLDSLFPVQSLDFKEKAYKLLEFTKNEGDSLGGVVEIVVFNPKIALGNILFDSLESYMSKALFAIPAVKAVEFGDGFSITSKKGSEVLDSFSSLDDKIITTSNHNGGINGGVSNGMPIIIRVGIKPTPTIKKPLTSLNYLSKKVETVLFEGNHDAFIVNRAIPALEGVIALTLLDLSYEKEI